MKAQQNDHHWHRSKLATLDVIVRCFGKQTWYIGSLIFNKSQKKSHAIWVSKYMIP